MLTADGCATRRHRLWERLPGRPDVIVITEPAHVNYFSGYCPSLFEFRSTNAGAILILGSDGTSTLIADNLMDAIPAHVDRRVAPTWYEGKRSATMRKQLLLTTAIDELRPRGGHIGYEAASLSWSLFEAFAKKGSPAPTPVDAIIHELRRQKDPDELDVICRSMRAGEAAHAAALCDVCPNMTELDVFQLVQRAAITSAGEPVLVYGDFVSGPRCERVGGPPTDRVIRAGDLVLLDFSVVICGYRGDFANTFVCRADPTPDQRRIFAACQEALEGGERELAAGRSCQLLYRRIHAVLDAHGYGRHFTTHAGHGLGLGHPDPPYVVPESSDALVTGDVITLEPGVYIDGVAGMRYERNYRITASGYELLSRHDLALTQPT